SWRKSHGRERTCGQGGANHRASRGRHGALDGDPASKKNEWGPLRGAWVDTPITQDIVKTITWLK
ncbi:TPA: hypothetical protein DEF17_02745, partial [bacterium]|nr:hypothetical protein [bacterium]